MTRERFFTSLAIAISIAVAFVNTLHTVYVVLIGLGILLVLIFITYLWDEISETDYKWVDKLSYNLSKNKYPYVIKEQITTYCITSASTATYTNHVEVINKQKKSNLIYCGKYAWDQKDDIKVDTNVSCSADVEKLEDLKWSTIRFKTAAPMDKNSKSVVSYQLTNLSISNLKKRSFLSSKIVEKIEKLKLIVKVDPTLHPTETATFRVLNSCGEEIPKTKSLININLLDSSYEKVIEYPRRGRKYIIQWDYTNQ